ncbi:hypothetical protein QW131_12600 [Roseibium salinum]|nr:hypothetical protein [Roseibium salinum]
MGTLLDFASARRPAARVSHGRNYPRPQRRETFGEVILFPGIRYERHDLDLAARDQHHRKGCWTCWLRQGLTVPPLQPHH